MTISLTAVHQEVSRLLEKTDQLLLQYFSGKKQVISELKTRYLEGLVTQADKQVEAIFKEALKKKFPQIGFIGEETGLNEIKDYNWIVDPIDGTMNFAHKIPLFGTSIALWKNNQPIYGVISLPMQKEIVHAFKGKGIFLNNKKITLKDKSGNKPKNKRFVLLATPAVGEDRLEYMRKILTVASYPRGYASAVFQGVTVALKRVDAFVIINLALWDIGAILPIAQEAGLHCQFISPRPDIHDPDVRAYKHSLIIGEKTLVNQLIPKIKQAL